MHFISASKHKLLRYVDLFVYVGGVRNLYTRDL